MAELPTVRDPNLIVGTETFDDAGVIRISDDLALVMTVDLITPVSNDPYIFGQVAAANSLSDVFAMGGEVRAALNVSCFPEDLPREWQVGILQGAADKVLEAKGLTIGGHTVEDSDLKFGLSVTGLIHPKRVLRNKGAEVGDLVILTKPIGTGVGISAVKMGLTSQAHHDHLMRNMATLNNKASEIALRFDAHCATDVTGFGLAGHSMEVARASGHRIRFNYEAIPRYSWFETYWQQNARTKVTPANQRLLGDKLLTPSDFQQVDFEFVCDPQTSGGLLLCFSEKQAEEALKALNDELACGAHIIGAVVDDSPAVEFHRSIL